MLKTLENKVLNNYQITKKEALKLYSSDLKELTSSANRIREHFCKNLFDMCTIINAKSGKCSENCKFCAQSSFHQTNCEIFPLLSEEKILSEAKKRAKQKIKRFSLVTSGRAVSNDEIEKICAILLKAKKEAIEITFCASLGLLNEEQYKALYKAGLRRIHNNLETSENFFPSMCTSHTFQDKVDSILLAQETGFEVCSGGIFGIGESIEDRIDLAFSLKALDIQSVPINILSPIKGTYYENQAVLAKEEVLRIVAIFRYILPKSFIRLAGGRSLLDDKAYSCFTSGANATITSDMLTTNGIDLESDKEMLVSLGFKTV